jgi:hypothetical protein
VRHPVASSDADLFVFLDADVRTVSSDLVVGLIGPLLVCPDLMLAKAAYRRPLYGRPGEGGRVTELVARPLLGGWFPTWPGKSGARRNRQSGRTPRSVAQETLIDAGLCSSAW